MNKVVHIISKAQHSLDMLDPAKIVYETIKVAASQCSGLTTVYVILTTGQIIRISVKILTGGVVGIGTAYIIKQIAEAIEEI